MQKKSIKIMFIIISFLFSGSDFPEEKTTKINKDWYKSTAWTIVHEDISLKQAKEIAVQKALKNIIEYSSGIEINNVSLYVVSETNYEVSMDSFSELTNTMSSGFILEKKIILEKTEQIDNTLIYYIEVEAKTGKLKGEKDPLFYLESKLNRDHYQEEDNMEIEITTNRDCYIFIFNILSDETVATLLPNEYIKNNLIEAGSRVVVPPEKSTINYKVGLPKNKKIANEMIMVVGIKAENKIEKSFNLNFGDYKMALKDLMRLIMKFDRSEIKQINLPYVIEEKK